MTILYTLGALQATWNLFFDIHYWGVRFHVNTKCPRLRLSDPSMLHSCPASLSNVTLQPNIVCGYSKVHRETIERLLYVLAIKDARMK
jgi:hypothetical protein